MEWIKHNVADQVDFVVWTGDSARHDNDEKIPRTQRQIIEQNEFMVNKFTEVFGDKKDGFKVPIVPTFGNNDIMPHNILLAGPNKWTTRYLNVWRNMIPETQRHQFQQGGWYWVEVVTNKLAVISLNTM
jgi:endopolyphosphatase